MGYRDASHRMVTMAASRRGRIRSRRAELQAACKEQFNLLAALFYLVRDFALLAAAAGVAWWCWEQYRTRQGHYDEVARTSLAMERQAADLKHWAGIIDGRAQVIATTLADLADAGRKTEERAAAKVRVHRLLQSTTEPFLTFAEIERGLGQVGRLAGLSPLAEAGAGVEEERRLVGDALRRVLMELVCDGVIAQLDRDRYFIASDYETGTDDDDEPRAA